MPAFTSLELDARSRVEGFGGRLNSGRISRSNARCKRCYRLHGYLALLIISWFTFSTAENAHPQVERIQRELFLEMQRQGFRIQQQRKIRGMIVCHGFQGDLAKVTVSIRTLAGLFVFPHEKSFLQCRERALEQAEQWIAIDAQRWQLDEDDCQELRLAANLQLAALERKLRYGIARLEDMRLNKRETDAELSSLRETLIEFLNPRFRSKQALYMKTLHRLK